MALGIMAQLLAAAAALQPTAPSNSRFWKWRGYNIRYTALGDDQPGPAILMVHGLFVNADHYRRNLPALAAAGYRAYAIDLLGYGYSDKPPPTSEAARQVSGERNRPLGAPVAELGTADGGRREAPVEQAHPLGSVYNFYTWAEQLADFAEQLVDVLLTPLLTEGASDVVFDTLSYSAGPLPEQLLQDARLATIPVSIVYGIEDPWTPAKRVESLARFAPVRGVEGLPGVGHCPHDEAPAQVNPRIIDFVEALTSESEA